MPPFVSEECIDAGCVHDAAVLSALVRVPRARFFLSEEEAREHRVLLSAEGHPSNLAEVVTKVLELAGLVPGSQVLEIGSASGYQTAVLSELLDQVHTMDINEHKIRSVKRKLKALGRTNVRYLVGDGRRGWPERGPYDAILLNVAVPFVPPALIEQLAEAGRLVAPIGTEEQRLAVIERRGGAALVSWASNVRFHPMRLDHGEAA